MSKIIDIILDFFIFVEGIYFDVHKYFHRSKIKFKGWQMPLYKWPGTTKSPEGSFYLGSFTIMFKGEITDTSFDVYIIGKDFYRAKLYISPEHLITNEEK